MPFHPEKTEKQLFSFRPGIPAAVPDNGFAAATGSDPMPEQAAVPKVPVENF